MALGMAGTTRSACRINFLPKALILRSYELWRELEQASNRELLHTVGYLFVGTPGSKRMSSSLESYGSEAVPHEVLDEAEI